MDITVSCNNKVGYSLIADSVFSDLVNHAFVFDESITWMSDIGKLKNNEANQVFRNISLNFYDGISGILLFLFAYYKFRPSSLSRSIYKKGINTFLRRLIKEVPLMEVGFHNGLAGVDFMLDIIKEDITNDEYNKAKSLIFLALLDKIKSTKQYDIISGLSGLIIHLIHQPNSFDSTSIDLLPQCVERLQELMIERENDIVFKNFKEAYLGGFSHGVSGVAYCLLLLSDFYNSSEFTGLAERCLNYELSLYNEAEANFIDMRLDYKGCCNYWCHGYPGISIALNKAYQKTKNKIYLSHIEKCYKNFNLDLKRLNSLSLCHGVFGNLAVFKEVSQQLDINQNLKDRADFEDNLVDRFGEDGFASKYLTEQKFIPGIMNGISGIGLFALTKCTGMDYLSKFLFNK